MSGKRLWLRADAEEGWVRQEAELVEIQARCLTVRVLEDDGLREVTWEQVEGGQPGDRPYLEQLDDFGARGWSASREAVRWAAERIRELEVERNTYRADARWLRRVLEARMDQFERLIDAFQNMLPRMGVELTDTQRQLFGNARRAIRAELRGHRGGPEAGGPGAGGNGEGSDRDGPDGGGVRRRGDAGSGGAGPPESRR